MKKRQYSDGFYLWVSTLFFLPFALYLRFVIGTSLILDKNYPDFSNTALFFGVLMISWLCWKWFRHRFQVAAGLDIYIALFLFVASLSTAVSVNPSLSLEKLIGLFSYILVFYFLLDVKRNATLWQGVINSILITAGFSSLAILISITPYIKAYQIGIVDFLTDPLYSLEALPRLPYSLLLHPSVTAGFLLLLIPLGFYEMTKARKFVWKLILGSGIGLNLIVMVLTRSRGGFIGLAFLGAATIIIYRKDLFAAFKKKKIIGTVAIILIAGIGIFVMAYLFGTRGFDLSAWSIQSRIQLWNAAHQIIREYPWLGAGLGNFGREYLRFRDPVFNARSFIHAHNQIIQITTELGLIGLISLGLLAWAYIKVLASPKSEIKAYHHAAFISLSGLFGATITDAIFTSAMIVFLLIFYLVWMLPEDGNWQRGLQSYQGLMITAIVVVVGSGSGWIAWKIEPYYKALLEAYSNNWQAASEQIASALGRDSQNPYYHYILGYTTGEQACSEDGGFDKAISHYLTALDSYPNWDISHANLAGLYNESGDFAQAAAHMERAISAYPYQPFYHCLLGDYYWKLGQSNNALSAYSKCISESPKILDSSYWRGDDQKIPLQDQVINQAKMLISESEEDLLLKAELLFYADDDQILLDSVLEYLATHPRDVKANQVYFSILDGMDRLPQVEKQLKKVIRDNPGIHLFWYYYGKVALMSGDLPGAEQAFTISVLRRETMEGLLARGDLSLDTGDLDAAQEYFRRALVVDAYPSLDFSRHVAGRWPMVGVYNSCLPAVRSYESYIEPILSSAINLEEDDCTLSACLLNKLVEMNPASQEAEILLRGLSCYKEFDSDNCRSTTD